MSTKSKKRNSQAQAQKRKRKEQKRQRKKSKTTKSTPMGIRQKHQRQIESLVPKAWQDELQCDVAVFDDQLLQQLDPEQQRQVAAVKTALDLVACGRLDDAENAVAEISRKDPMSQWRLLVRGLKHWHTNEMSSAEKAWSRLDLNRRPARIAFALTLAHRGDLHQVSIAEETPSDVPPAETQPNIVANEEAAIPVDSSLLLAAKVVRRMRIDRSAIKTAAAVLVTKEELESEVEGFKIGPEKIKRIYEFAQTYRQAEPELVEAIELAALQRATHQPFSDVFEAASKNLRGPAHDRKNYLRSFLYFISFEEPAAKDEADRFLRKYLTIDLPFNEEISASLRSAILSVAWLREAQSAISLQQGSGFGFFGLYERETRSSQKKIRKCFAEAIKAYPANRDAHKYFTDWLMSELDERDLSKAGKQKLNDELIAAMEQWAKKEPANVEPRQFLAETLLENERIEEAAPHVQWLMSTRPEAPLLKALPWKLKLLEAMQLSRRKTNLSKVPAALEELETQWPQWLSKQWLPYFRAALALRQGNEPAYQALRDSICQASGLARDSVADACMMLGAAQKMKVASADLKPLRAPVDAAVKRVKSLPIEDLLAAGSFFWDILKTNISYPAFRRHGGKFGRELLDRVKQEPTLVASNIKNRQFLDCLFWFSQNSFWANNYESKTLPSLLRLKLDDPNIAAAHLNATVRKRWVGRDAALLETADYLKQAARSEPDSFNRYWFTELAEKAVEKDRESKQSFGIPSMFANMFGASEENDSQCDCPSCRAERAVESDESDEPYQYSLF